MATSTFFIWILFLGITASEALNCSVGWFGSNCQYRCHCKNTSSCATPPCDDDYCDDEGNCINNSTCELGWFGPACQYLDLVQDARNNSGLRKIMDGNDESCGINRTSIALNWTFAYTFYWLRLSVRDQDLLHSFEVKYKLPGRNLSRGNCTKLEIDNRTLDMFCLEKRVNAVVITGKGVRSLCSVYISGGRNVALKQKTAQSSTYNNKGKSENAVDGDRTRTYNLGSCTHTNNNDLEPNWNVTLSRSAIITQYVLYNRDGNRERLKGFIITGYNESNTQVFNYEDKEAVKNVYRIPTRKKDHAPILSVNIQSSNNITGRKYLTLCEVQLYGDSVCDPQRYGRECEHRCNCTGEGNTCYVSTGGCSRGCSVGYRGEACHIPCGHGKYGTGCRSKCSPNCHVTDASSGDSPCDHISGHCLQGCTEGYQGHMCLEEKSLYSNAAVVGSLFTMIILVILATVGLIFFKRSRNSKRNKVVKISGEEGIYSKQNDGTAIAFKDLDNFLATHDINFFWQQFRNIPHNTEALMTVGKSPENKSKNRYKDICAYDHSRVVLNVDESKKHGSYINASYVESNKPEEKFIAAQGPTMAVLEDFVRMLWETQAEKVVMLTNLSERGKRKCERYWPENGKIQVGEIVITHITTQIFADYTIRRLQLQKDDEPPQTVTHFHFTSWPDKDVPATPWGLVDFEQRVFSSPTNKPVVVHCSAGIGRTGTFIALHNIVREAVETDVVDCFMAVQKLRRDRINMIQTYLQYEFLHRAVQIAVLFMNTSMASNNIHQQIKILEKKSKGKVTNMEEEFKMICAVTKETCNKTEDCLYSNQTENIYENCKSADTSLKNRFCNILPKECSRAILQPELDGMGDYINAVLVPSLNQRDQNILTQFPLPETVTDFWRLVVQYNVLMLVTLEQEQTNEDQTICEYLPTRENETTTYSFFNIKTESVRSDCLWELQTVTIHVNPEIKPKLDPSLALQGEHRMCHLKFNCHDLDAGKLLVLIKQIRSHKPDGNARILYTCRSGATLSGLACLLSLLLDRLDNDHQLNVPMIAGTVKAIRPAVIPTFDQYRLLYQVIKLHSNESNLYSSSGHI